MSGHQSVGGCDRGESPYAQEYETPRHGSVNYAMANYGSTTGKAAKQARTCGEKGGCRITNMASGNLFSRDLTKKKATA